MSARELITEHLDLWTGAVTQKSTRGRGRSGKVELTGIKKLRELILDLALRGKLTEQLTSDGSTQALLQHLEDKKQKLETKGTIKTNSNIPSIDEHPFAIPPNWAWVRLGHIGLVGSSRRVRQRDWQNHGIPFYRAREIVKLSQNGDVDNELFISRNLYDELAKNGQVPETNDLMVTGVGTIGVPYIVKPSDQFYFKDASVLIFKNLFGICPQFLYNFCHSPFWTRTIHADSMGTTVHTLTIVRANLAPVPLPPLDEQYRIVQKVDELMALCDRLEQQTSDQLEAHETLVDTLLGTLTQSKNATELADNWARLATHFDTLFTTEQSIDKLKQTILQLAVMGRLVEQGAGYTPPSALLEKISSERLELAESGKIKLSSRHAALTSQEPAPFAIRTSWHWTHLESLFAVVTDGDHQAPPKSEQGIPFLVIGNLNAGEINFTSCKYVSEDYFDNLDWSRKPTKGDLLYTVTGSYGIPIKVDTDRAFCVQRHVAILKATDSTPRDFIKLLLASEYGLSYADNVATGIAQKTVPLSGLRKMPVPLPPVQEQHRIVQKVDELMALCDQLKERLNQAGETRCQLAEAVVDEALN